MSDSYKLDDLLYSIKASIYRANRKAWMQHLNNLKKYFKPGKNGVWEPLMIRMMLPKTEVEEGDNTEVEENRLPYASLVEHTPLTMANLTVEFECYIEGLTGSSKESSETVSLVIADDKRNLPRAKFAIEYKTNEATTEGIARINDKLLKHF